MALWSQVLSGFDHDDETINFGARTIAENNGSLYEACTMAMIQSSEQVDQKPNVLASIQYSKLFVAIDKSITIFENETCDKILLNTSFPHPISCYCVSKDSFFLFTVLTNRTLCCFHILEMKLISMTSILDNEAGVSDNIITIFYIEQNEEIFIILVSNAGAIYRFSFKYYSTDVNIASSNINEDVIKEYAIDMQCSQLFEGFTSLEFLDAIIDTSLEELSIVMVGTVSIFTWPNKHYNNFNGIFPYGYKKIRSLKGSGKMLCLRTNHILTIMCPTTFVGLQICNEPVFDFTIIQHDNIKYCEILFLSQSKKDAAVYTLYLVSYPDFEQKLQINIPSAIHLFENLHTSNNIYYIEGINTENNLSNIFKIKMMSESIPEMRLTRLLRKKQFDEAEKFAKKLALSTEPIYFSKATLLIEQLSPWAKSPSSSVNINTLINILDKIQNVQYITECCSKALISDYVQMKQLYLYTRQRVMQDIKKGNINDQLNFNLSLINNALRRLETFQMIQDTNCETDTLLYNDITMKEWIKFSQANLLEEYNNHLRMGQLKSATLIWTRHFSDIIKHISVQTVRDIFLEVLPEDVAPLSLWPWLTYFIPTLLSLLPDALDEIVSWSLKKLKYLEIFYRTGWPEIGIDFAEKLIKLLKFKDNQQSMYFQQEYRYQNSVLKQLMLILQALSDIQQLKVAYRLKVPVDTYIGSPIEVINMLLDKIHLDEIPNFINTFLKQYMLNNNLQNDSILCAYIQKTIKNSDNWWLNEEITWEKRITIIIGFIHNLENRLEQTLEILKKASVPWSSTIVTLVEISSNFDHILSSKIKIECDYVAIKVVLKKYGYATIGINNRLISRVIKENRDSIINDLNVLTKNDQELRGDAFCRCINARLNEGNLQKAMDILCHLENNITDALYCYEGIIDYVIAAFSFQDMKATLMYHMEILGCLEFKMHNLWAQSKVDIFRYNDIISTLKDLKSLYILRKDYNINITLKDYRMQKLPLLQKCITKLLIPTDIQNDLSVIHKTVIKIAELLGLKKTYATLFLFEQTTSIDTLRQIISNYNKNLNLTPDECENTNKICLSVLQHATISGDVIEMLKNLSASILNICLDDDLQSSLLLYTCISICPSFLIQHSSNVKKETTSQSNWKLYTIYKDQVISLDQRLMSLFKDMTFFCLYYSKQFDDNTITNYNERTDQLLNNFLAITNELQFQCNDHFLLQTFKTFYFTYCNIYIRDENTLEEMKSILSQLLKNLLKKLCTGRLFDLHLGLACLFMLSEQEAYTWISTVCTSFQADYIRHSIISTLGYEYSCLKKDQSLIQKFENYNLLHIWAQRLSHYSITYKEVLTNNTASKREILQQIISSNKENVIPLLRDYCCSFGFNFNDCLLLYLQTLVKTWNPTISTSNTIVNKELTICKDEIDKLRKKCDEIVAHMRNKSTLKRCISTLWEHITFYHYEVFIILMNLVEDKDMIKRNYLCFLQNYTRSGPPTLMEHEKWVQLNPGHNTLPPIAQWRLPYLPEIDIWKLITPELNLRTYDKWLNIAPVLNLETHLICTLAIKGEVNRIWADKAKNTTWLLHSKNTTLLKEIKKCIQQMTDSDGFYYGTAALYYVVNHTPPGADRVAAAKECYAHAQLAAQNSTKFEEGMLEKIESKYLRFTSEHILRTHGLEKDKYFALIESPWKLLRELYNDESIPLRYRSASIHRPDINTAINELGKLFSLNMIKLRLELLQEWLLSNRDIELSQSFTETLAVMKGSEQNTDSKDNLIRACYMLEYKDTDLFAQFLINIGFGDHHGETEYNYNARYRAFLILQNIVDAATLEELTKRDIYTFKKYLKSLQYVGKLESLGLCYSIDAFETCSKRELIQILWKSQRHSPYALCVIAQICIEFKIYDILLWDDILCQMTKLRMISELKTTLLHLCNETIIVNCDGYKVGWQFIISEPFREIDMNPNSEHINKCIKAICLLYSCPIAHELDFHVITKNCFQYEQAYLAAALLPFLNESERKFILKIINEDYKMIEIIKDLNNLSSKGVLTVAHSLVILQKSVP